MERVAVFTSGGDAPGMNACLRAVVRGAIYHGIDIYGIKYGYNGMIEGDIYKMKSYSVSNIVQKGGTILKSARSMSFKTPEGRAKAYEQLQKHKIEGLVAIGGDGTFTGANVFYEEYGIPTVGAPGTIDNDLYGTDFTIGFDTAVNTALEAIDKIRDTANSHDRIFFIEVMGRDSGYIAIESAVGGGAEMVLVPELTTHIEDVVATIKQGWSKSKTSSIIIVAEGSDAGDAFEVARKVEAELDDEETKFKVTTLGHIQRGGSPSAADRLLASRLGLGALEGLLDGQKNVMAGIINNSLVYTRFSDAISKTKPINQDLIRLIKILSI